MFAAAFSVKDSMDVEGDTMNVGGRQTDLKKISKLNSKLKILDVITIRAVSCT